MNAFHALLKVLLGIALLCAIPFVIEILLGAYETNRNPWTQPGAIVADGGPVRAGLNRRQFNEIRFRSTGMRIYFTATSLPQAAADGIETDVAGRLQLLRDGKELLAYDFRLEPRLKKDIGGLDAEDSVGALGVIGIVRKYDVECAIVPKRAKDAAAADSLYKREFDVGESVEIAFAFEGKVPETASLVFSYSKCPSSLLRGTFLERIARRLPQINL